ncbi:dihydroorotate dehydrogenase electron transfer subunit [Pyrofollis japonicus]|uniref:iron-sulfur cluster-binding protein n=1 Tax=Pyrofollis japonicus TaxID=3060460 RepID=UPI00295AC5D7|nr:hypothetical protein [Pyrofollis japonicus]BEP17392.1 dihydroorotate dehydrogenase electron transfer subunit [Pyrofollis japonicus]
MGVTRAGLRRAAGLPRYRYTSLGLGRVVWRSKRGIILEYRYLGDSVDILPGQFVHFWVPGYEAIPLTPLYSDEDVVVFLVAERGPTTRKIVQDPPRYAGVIAPLGRPVNPTGPRILLVAGGVGVASVASIARSAVERGLETVLVYGARSGDELAPIEPYVGDVETLYATEDGSKGVRGTVIDALVEEELRGFSEAYAAGPPAMLCRLYELQQERRIADRLYMAPERVIRCGLGFCGKCAIPGTTKLLCRDGAFLDSKELSQWVRMGCPVNG